MATKSVYADDDSDSERGYMLRKGARAADPAEKSWSWQCQAVAYAVVVVLLVLNLRGGDGTGGGIGALLPELAADECADAAPKQRKIVAIGGGQAADKPWVRDTIIEMSGTATPTVLYGPLLPRTAAITLCARFRPY